MGESLTELRWILIGWFFLFRFTGRFVFTFEFELEHFSLEKLYYRKIGLFSDSVFSFIWNEKKKEVLFSPKINFERRRSRFALLYVYLLSMFSPPTRLRLIKIASRAENWISRRLLILAWSDFWSIFDHDTRKNAEIIAVRSQYDIYIVTQIAKSRI